MALSPNTVGSGLFVVLTAGKYTKNIANIIKAEEKAARELIINSHGEKMPKDVYWFLTFGMRYGFSHANIARYAYEHC